MAYLNKVMLIGNVGKDPEFRQTQNGKKCVSFSIATSRRYRDNNGEQKEQTDWHNIVGWGKTADIVKQLNVKKGICLYVEGTLTNRSWTDQNGQKRYTTEVNMETFQVLTPRTFAQNSNPYSAQNNQDSRHYQGNQQAMDYPAGASEEDDLPF